MTISRSDWRYLDKLQKATFAYFWKEANPDNGLVPDNTRTGAPCSIAGMGLALGNYAVAAERGYIGRAQAARRSATTLRFFAKSVQGPQSDATGHRGFYYHFLDMRTGRRAWRSELSTIDTAILLVGMLAAAAYFDGSAPEERQLRELAEQLYRRADWAWALNRAKTVSHGWRPERGFIRCRWEGYSKALLLYILGLASPTHPLPASSYRAWTATYSWRKMVSHYGFKCSFNPSFPVRNKKGWLSQGYYALDQGPIVVMIENQRSELIWGLMRASPHIRRGLRRAGFAGGWLETSVQASSRIAARR